MFSTVTSFSLDFLSVKFSSFCLCSKQTDFALTLKGNLLHKTDSELKDVSDGH